MATSSSWTLVRFRTSTNDTCATACKCGTTWSRTPTTTIIGSARNLLPHLKNVAPAVLIVGGWFDAEDLYGPLNIYRQVETDNPGIQNMIVMGPWAHGGWSRGSWRPPGQYRFRVHQRRGTFSTRSKLSSFTAHLKDGTPADAGRSHDVRNRRQSLALLRPVASPRDETPAILSFRQTIDSARKPQAREGTAYDEFVSDPHRPVPFTEDIDIGMTRAYMTDDQRFAARRPDVLVYQTRPLDHPITLCGPLGGRPACLDIAIRRRLGCQTD